MGVMQRKRKFKESCIELGKRLQRLPFLWVIGFVSVFTAVLLTWILSESKLDILSSVIITLSILLGTGLLSLVLWGLVLGAGKLIEWLFSRRVKKSSPKIDFDWQAKYPKNNRREYF
jgi:uncharacterized membrane protein YhaH (DUF805 family)